MDNELRSAAPVVRESAPDRSPWTPAVVPIVDRRQETGDVFTVTLAAPDGYRFRPGQFNMVTVFGVGECALSLAGASDEPTLRHTVRAVGSVTRALARLRPGDRVGLRGPYGSSWPLDQAAGHDLLLIAGGVGLPPLRPVMYHVLQRPDVFGRVTVLYGVRSPADILYRDELQQWAKQPGLKVWVIVAQADVAWRGPVGFVTTLFPALDLNPSTTWTFMCGPEAMMRFAARLLEERGVPDERIFLSLERNMQCAVGFCGHCQFGPEFVCMDGPVFSYWRIRHFFTIREA